MKRLTFLATAIALVALMIWTPSESQAQTSSILYGSSRNPLMNSANPAFFPSRSRVYLSLPGVNMNFVSPLAYNSIFQYDSTEGKTYINANSILDTLAQNGALRLGTNIHAIGLGMNFERFFITFSTQAKVDMSFAIPQGLVTFLNEGNYGHVGDDYIELLDGQLLTTRVYGEAALGFGMNINENLTIGARAKLLVGYFDLSTAGSSARLYTAEDYSAITGVMDLNLNSTSVLEETTDAEGNKSYKIKTFMPKNYGINLDLGVHYHTDLFEVSASIVDFGPGIHWTDNVHRIVSARENNSFTFSGIDVSTMMSGGRLDSAYAQTLIDSLKALTEYKTIDGEDYWTATPTKVNIGGMFHVSPGFSAGLHFHGEFDRGVTKMGDVFKTKTVGFYSNTSLLARLNIQDWVEIVASASVITNNGHWNWFNPGFGITLTPLRTFQVYAFLDYISNIYLIDAKQFNVSLGLNLFLGSSSAR